MYPKRWLQVLPWLLWLGFIWVIPIQAQKDPKPPKVQWSKFTSAEDRFSINFPGKPTIKTGMTPFQGKDLPIHRHFLEIPQTIFFSAQVFDYPTEFSTTNGSDAGLDGMTQLIESQGGKVLSRTKVHIQ